MLNRELPEIPLKRILIFRTGSLGDAIVSLPAIDAIQVAFPEARFKLLTNLPVSAKAASWDQLLGLMPRVDGTLMLPDRSSFADCLVFWRALRSWRPDGFVYLSSPRKTLTLILVEVLMRFVGVKRLIGIPWHQRQRHHRFLGKFYEHESERLLRCLMPDVSNTGRSFILKDLAVAQTGVSWDPVQILDWGDSQEYLAFSIGTKNRSNDWGDENWESLLQRLAHSHPALGLVAIGAPDERARSDALLSTWSGPIYNACGRLTILESAQLLREARLFLGHDSGPGHLAALMGTPQIGIYGARNAPGIWSPLSDVASVIMRRPPCEGCRLTRCEAHDNLCLRAISPDEVEAMAVHLLEGGTGIMDVRDIPFDAATE